MILDDSSNVKETTTSLITPLVFPKIQVSMSTVWAFASPNNALLKTLTLALPLTSKKKQPCLALQIYPFITQILKNSIKNTGLGFTL